DLLDDHEPFLAGFIDRERGPAARPERRMRRLHRPLDVLRVMVATADDEEVLEPPGDVELAVQHEAEIAGAEVLPGRPVREPRAEDGRRLFPAAPVALGHARSVEPDLALDTVVTELSGLRIDDADDLLVLPRAAADDGAHAFGGATR